MNIRRLFIEWDHLVQLCSIAVLAVLRAPAAHRKVAQCLVSRVEMTVVHKITGRINGPGLDLETCPFFAFAPDHGEALPLRHANNRAWPVAVERAPAARRKLLDVTAIGRSRKTEAHDLHALALHRIIIESERIDVRDQITFPRTHGEPLVLLKEFPLRAKPVAELEGITEDKIIVVKQ